MTTDERRALARKLVEMEYLMVRFFKQTEAAGVTFKDDSPISKVNPLDAVAMLYGLPDDEMTVELLGSFEMLALIDALDGSEERADQLIDTIQLMGLTRLNEEEHA